MILTADELLTWAGVTVPTPADSEWATLAADAVNDAVVDYLDRKDSAGVPYPPPSDSPFRVDRDYLDLEALADGVTPWDTVPEVRAAARLAASELYRRRDAPFGTTGYVDPTSGQLFRLARDYLTSVEPILWRYRDVSGLVA